MIKINKFRLYLFGLAMFHIIIITIGIVNSPFGFLNNIIVFGNFIFLMLNGFILGGSFALEKGE